MITLNKMRYQVLESLNQYSDDARITIRLIDQYIVQKRSTFVRREHNKNRSIDPAIIQRLSCVDLELISSTECAGICAEGSTLLRTVKKIPNSIELHHEKMLTRIALVDLKEIPIPLLDYDRAIYWGNSRFNKNKLAAFLLNGYLYLIYNENVNSLNLVDKIEIQGVFEDPKEAGQFSDCEGTPCFNPDGNYPINQWMWDIILPEIVKDLVLKFQLVTDKDNNANDDTQINASNGGKSQ